MREISHKKICILKKIPSGLKTSTHPKMLFKTNVVMATMSLPFRGIACTYATETNKESIKNCDDMLATRKSLI